MMTPTLPNSRRRRAALALAGIVLTSLVATGCAGQQAPASSGGGGKTVHLTTVFDTTGPGASYSTDSQTGFDLAIELAQADGPLKGLKIDRQTEDTGGVAQRGVTLAQRLVGSDSDVVVYGTLPTVAEAMVSTMQAGKVPFLIAQATTATELRAGDYVFPTAPTYKTTHEALMKYFHEQGVKTVAVLYPADASAYRELVEKDFPTFADQYGLKFTNYQTAIAATDFTTIVRTILATKPDAFYTPIYDNQYVTVAGLVHQAGYQGIFATQSSEAAALPTLDKQALESVQGTIISDFYSPALSCDGAKAFQDAYQKKYAKSPSAYAAGGYNAGLLVVRGIELAKGDYSRSGIQAGIAAAEKKGIDDAATCSLTFKGNEPITTGVVAKIVGDTEEEITVE